MLELLIMILVPAFIVGEGIVKDKKKKEKREAELKAKKERTGGNDMLPVLRRNLLPGDRSSLYSSNTGVYPYGYNDNCCGSIFPEGGNALGTLETMNRDRCSTNIVTEALSTWKGYRPVSEVEVTSGKSWTGKTKIKLKIK
ncbi:MAG: hypothetical protein U5L76_05785 [Patescibacteria group bacterium]|nr:hypothetical protein [Patescibacteria group bacterium]MDZ7799077.1 hypothetical protein [Patescibacteria group bacterium]